MSIRIQGGRESSYFHSLLRGPMAHGERSSQKQLIQSISKGLGWTALVHLIILATGPLAAVQLRLAPRDQQLRLVTYAVIYYTISAPTAAFQAVSTVVVFPDGTDSRGLLISTQHERLCSPPCQV